MPVLIPVIVSLVLLLFFLGKIVQGKCDRKFEYHHPNDQNICLMCRICPDDIAKDPKMLDRYMQPKCKYDTLPGIGLVQCHSEHFDIPSCPGWKPKIGRVSCTNNNAAYSNCSLVCPSGYQMAPPSSSQVTCLTEPDLHWSLTDLPVCVACTVWEPMIGHVSCTNGNAESSTCHLECPPGHHVSSSSKVTCLAKPHFHWSQPTFPVCIEAVHKYIDHHHKRFSIAAIIFIGMVLLFLMGPWVIPIFVILWKKQQDQEYRRLSNVFPDENHIVNIIVKNAKRSQRSYVIRNKWVAKKGSNIRIEASVIDPSSSSRSLAELTIRNKVRGEVIDYVSDPSAPMEIVIRNVNFCHQGQFLWSARFVNGDVDKGHFFLDVKQTLLRDVSRRPSLLVECCGGDAHYMQLKSSPAPDLGQLMKNGDDVRRLCQLFDHEESDSGVTWHKIAQSDLLGWDRQNVNHEEYHMKGKKSHGPTNTILVHLHQNGITIKEFVDFLKKHLHPSHEAIQILDGYL